MGLSYDFDIHWLVPRELYSEVQVDAFRAKTGEPAEVRGSYTALFRNSETARALLGADEPVRRFFEDVGFGFNVYDSGAPTGRYPMQDEAAHIDVIERVTAALCDFDPDAHDMNGFEFEAFLDHLAGAEPWMPAAAPAKSRQAFVAFPLKAAAVFLAVVGSAIWFIGDSGPLSGQVHAGFQHTLARGGE